MDSIGWDLPFKVPCRYKSQRIADHRHISQIYVWVVEGHDDEAVVFEYPPKFTKSDIQIVPEKKAQDSEAESDVMLVEQIFEVFKHRYAKNLVEHPVCIRQLGQGRPAVVNFGEVFFR